MQAQELLDVLVKADQAYKEALALAQEQGAEMFKTIRQERDLTQRQLADVLHVDFSTISKIENGHIRPGKPVLRRLAAWLQKGTLDRDLDSHADQAIDIDRTGEP